MQRSRSYELPGAPSLAVFEVEDGPDLSRRFRPGEALIRAVLMACGIVSIFTTVGIVLVLAGNTVAFFQARAWVLARQPVAASEPLAQLTTAIEDHTISLPFVYLADGSQFNNQQYLLVGSEIMRITKRGTSTIEVTRGMKGTQPTAYPAGTAITPMTEDLAKAAEALPSDDTSLRVSTGFGHLFTPGEEIEVDAEIMRVSAVEGDTLTVERGVQGTVVNNHTAGANIAIPDPVTFGEFISNTLWQPQSGEFGILPLITATLLISGVALAVAIPLGLGAAVYLSEYARPGVRNALKPTLEVLAGIPTVVYGFFALTFVTPTLRNLLFGASLNSLNMLAAGITVGVLITPLISSMCEDAISAVPRSLREASYAVGATRLETTVKVVLPAAVSGISAGIILAMSRAVGETMVVLLAAGAGPNFTFDLRQSAETMAGHIARISTGDISYGSLDYTSIFAVGMTLFVSTLALNIVSDLISRRLRERY